jgi:hypothetical protein
VKIKNLCMCHLLKHKYNKIYYCIWECYKQELYEINSFYLYEEIINGLRHLRTLLDYFIAFIRTVRLY